MKRSRRRRRGMGQSRQTRVSPATGPPRPPAAKHNTSHLLLLLLLRCLTSFPFTAASQPVSESAVQLRATRPTASLGPNSLPPGMAAAAAPGFAAAPAPAAPAAVIWDLDGTLLDTEVLCEKVARGVVQRCPLAGLPVACRSSFAVRPDGPHWINVNIPNLDAGTAAPGARRRPRPDWDCDPWRPGERWRGWWDSPTSLRKRCWPRARARREHGSLRYYNNFSSMMEQCGLSSVIFNNGSPMNCTYYTYYS